MRRFMCWLGWHRYDKPKTHIDVKQYGCRCKTCGAFKWHPWFH